MDNINRNEYINKLNVILKNKTKSKTIENSIYNFSINQIDDINDSYLMSPIESIYKLVYVFSVND